MINLKLMEFCTPINIDTYPFRLSHSDKGFMVGSCFIENISRKISQIKMQVCANPTGVLYNPISIARTLDFIEKRGSITDDMLMCEGGVWFSFMLHSKFSSVSKTELLTSANNALREATTALNEADYIVITLGTAWVYNLASTAEVVCNCHKVSQKSFTRRSISITECTEALSEIFERELYKKKKIILTLSPIRHTKDGFIENSLSKAILRVAIAELEAKFENVVYFPAYEIMNDELRDYRFYASDMIHPSQVAVDYIWERFSQELLGDKELIKRIERMVAASQHRPFNPDSHSHKKFIKTQLDEIAQVKNIAQHIDFSNEIAGYGQTDDN